MSLNTPLPFGEGLGERLSLHLPFQEYAMVYAWRQFLFIVCHHDKSFAWSLTESIYNLLHQLSVFVVQTMQRLV